MRSAECGMARLFRGIGEGRARRRAARRAGALGGGRAGADAGGGVPGCSVRAGAERARARSRQGVDARGRGCAAGSLPPSPSSSGASGACSPASTATRSTGCVRRSSRSPRPTSCGSCYGGSAPHRTPGPRGRRDWEPCWSCSTGTKYRQVRGKRTCSRRGSASTTRCGSTACVSRGRSPGAGCRPRRRRMGGATRAARFAPRRLRCFAGSGGRFGGLSRRSRSPRNSRSRIRPAPCSMRSTNGARRSSAIS